MPKFADWVETKKEKKKRSIIDGLDHDISFTEKEIANQQIIMNDLQQDLKTFKHLKDLIGDKIFKNQKEYVKYLLSLDGDIMKDYERLYGESDD